jgi:phage shock protein A
MFDRLSRLIRSWVGFFISMAEDPEVMLQEAVEEMRATMPKLNSVLVATRATCIRLEEERDLLERQEKNLISSIQAALKEGSAAARSIAEDDALALQQIRTELTATREQLVAAQHAHDNSKMSVDALKARLQGKIEACQKAMKERQKAQVMKQAADAITELQSYGVAMTTDKFLEKIKQEVAESKAAVEVATGGLDTAGIEKERVSRKIKAAGVLQQFEMEMGIVNPAAIASTQTSAPTVGARVAQKDR